MHRTEEDAPPPVGCAYCDDCIGCADVGIQSDADDSDQHYDEVRYMLFLGMGDRGPEEIQVIEGRMTGLITSTGNGYTLEHEQGGYVLDGEIRKDDVSLKFVIIDADFEDIEYIVDTFKKEFNQKLIYMEREDVIGGFF